MRTCENCCYQKEGLCRRYPPKFFPVQSQNSLTGQVEMQVMFLPVQAQANNWCGEFKEVEKKLGVVN